MAIGVLVALAAMSFPAGAGAHAERETFFPDPNQGAFPEYRTDGPFHVVCTRESRRLIRELPSDLRRDNLKLMAKCRFRSIQRAVNHASNGYRIMVLPGVYDESEGPAPHPSCLPLYSNTGALTYEQHRQCKNAQNLIAILGDTNGDRICDSKCNIQIEGTGDGPEDVLISGQRSKLNVIRADRADGIYLKNFTVEFSDFNNIYFLETNGFRVDTVVSRYSREYAILSFTSDHGIYENCDTSYSGDSGIYPGSGPNARHGQPDAHGHAYGIIVRNCESHHNTIGSSGTAGNGTLFQDNRFHHNATGVTTDSFAGGHPGMPQDSSKWVNNQIYSNNNNLFDDERDAYCRDTPWEERDPQKVCPTFQVPVGTGLLIAGGNANIVEENYIFDNWRNGTMQFWVPAALRGEEDSAKTYDTSANNQYLRNCMGTRPSNPDNVDFSACQGTADLNGTDFWWDEEEGQDCIEEQPGCVDTHTELGNCWTGNQGSGGAYSSDPPALVLPACPGLDFFRPGNSGKQAFLVPCATWHPIDNPDPAGCDWFTTPQEPN